MNVLATILQFVGPNKALEVFGVKLVGINATSGRKFLFTLGWIVVVTLLGYVVSKITRKTTPAGKRVTFWLRQAIGLFTALLLIVGIGSIWFTDPANLTSAIGLVTAGVAFALQRVITAFAGYILILRGNTFNVGDRIVMGGVRGDVVGLGFMQTTIMEMGQPPRVQDTDPAMWVRSRQYTGRIVTVTNDKIFDVPVFNYTRDFPFIWEELTVPISYKDRWQTVEQILIDVAGKHTMKIEHLSEPALKELERRFATVRSDLHPRVYLRMTDNWVELTVRFIAEDHHIRDLKDAMSRDLLAAMNTAHIGVASGTYEIVGLPPIKIEQAAIQTSYHPDR